MYVEVVQVEVVWVVMGTHEHTSSGGTAEAGDAERGQVIGQGG